MSGSIGDMGGLSFSTAVPDGGLTTGAPTGDTPAADPPGFFGRVNNWAYDQLGMTPEDWQKKFGKGTGSQGGGGGANPMAALGQMGQSQQAPRAGTPLTGGGGMGGGMSAGQAHVPGYQPLNISNPLLNAAQQRLMTRLPMLGMGGGQ